jgi:hypothetical protein
MQTAARQALDVTLVLMWVYGSAAATPALTLGCCSVLDLRSLVLPRGDC